MTVSAAQLDQCPICLENGTPELPLVPVAGTNHSSDLNHLFHHACLLQLNESICPLCRGRFTQIDGAAFEPIARAVSPILNSPENELTAAIIFRGELVIEAAQEGRLSMVEELLQGGPISIEDRKRAMIAAVRIGHLELLRLLENETLSGEDFVEVFLRIRELNLPDSIVFFFADRM